MKTIKIPDDAHARLTGILGLLMAKSGKQQTYADALRALTVPSGVVARRNGQPDRRSHRR